MTGPTKGSGAVNERPQYVRISALLRDRIVSGAYGVGALLPTEGDLCKEFKISRHTVRDALRLLTDRGLISRGKDRAAGSWLQCPIGTTSMPFDRWISCSNV